MIITKWYKQNKSSGLFEFNHIENGFDNSDSPDAISEAQRKYWRGCLWHKEKALLIDGKVINYTINNTQDA